MSSRARTVQILHIVSPLHTGQSLDEVSFLVGFVKLLELLKHQNGEEGVYFEEKMHRGSLFFIPDAIDL